MDCLFFTHQIHSQSVPITVVIVYDGVCVPEYFYQVTRGHNTSVLHAKYLSYDVLINGKLFGKDCIVANGSFKSEVPGPYGRFFQQTLETDYPLSEGGLARYYWSQVEKSSTIAWLGYMLFSVSDGRIVCTRNVGSWIFDYHSSEYPSFADIESLVPTTNRLSSPRFSDGSLTVPDLPNPVTAFRFAEPSLAMGRLRLDSIIGYPLVLQAMEDCVLSCIDEIARLNENSIANLIGAVGFVFTILHGKFDVPRSWKKFLSKEALSRLWLWWRYAYSTGVMDHNQALDYLERQVAHYARTNRYHASSNIHVNDVDLQVSLSMDIRVRDDDIMTMLSHRAWASGMELNPYVLWDLIPFSFVVDWFTDTGDRLQQVNDLKHLYADYEISNICWSFRYQTELQFGTVECYYRFYGPLPELDGYSFHPRGVSQATMVKRGVDSAALILGGS